MYFNWWLFLGLFFFESYFVYYLLGSFYKKYYDVFCGEVNCVLFVVLYLNFQWGLDDGGELVIYLEEYVDDIVVVMFLMGIIVIFLSEEFFYEVLFVI